MEKDLHVVGLEGSCLELERGPGGRHRLAIAPESGVYSLYSEADPFSMLPSSPLPHSMHRMENEGEDVPPDVLRRGTRRDELHGMY